MATSVVMPALEMGQESGRLTAWRKREGDAVSRGEPLMDVETDKAVLEVDAEADGVLAGVTAQEGDVIAVGQTIAWILAPGEAVPATAQPMAAAPASAAPAKALAHAEPAAGATPAPSARPQMSPKARRLAAERGLDVRALQESADGVVRAADVEAARPHEAPVADTWRIMAERVTESWRTVPQFFVTRTADAGAIVELRGRLAGADPGESGVTYTDVLVALVARVLTRHPRANSSWLNGTIVSHPAVNIGIATAIEHGVVVPSIAGADRLTVAEIAGRRHDLIARARGGRLHPADLSGGTFTISNLGTHKVDAFTAIVVVPQAAILAVGGIADRVVARDGVPTVRPQVTLTLTSDHRVLDGARAALFMIDLVDAIEHPERVLA